MLLSSFEEPYLQSVLEKIAVTEGFKKPKYEISLGSKPGDNYIGRIFRTVITETLSNNKRVLSLIFKVAPLSKARQEKLSCDDVFKIEGVVYQTILPTFNRLLNKYGVVKSDTFPGTARCYAVQLNEGSFEDQCHVLVLEDKGFEGFGMLGASQNKQFDLDHCQKVIKRLALWHAASLALIHLEPKTAERLNKLIDNKSIFFVSAEHPLVTEWRGGAEDSLMMLQEPFEKGSKNFDKVEDLVLNYEIEMAKSNSTPPDLSCITHGDCWFNNILFQYNKDGSLNDVCLIDLQVSRLASPASDLAFMLLLCTTKDIRDAHYDDLIRLYHDEVSSHLKKMNCDPAKIIPWDLLQTHLRKYSKVGILMALTGIPVMTADSSAIQIDIMSPTYDGNCFAGCAKITDPKKLAEVSKRITDVMVDCHRWNYF